MENNIQRGRCGCKGIRTCLVCEDEKNKELIKSVKKNEELDVYTFCALCNLFWSTEYPYPESIPLYLGNVSVYTDFINTAEETGAINAIDDLSWNLSQSGRRKQDFGPKVNFKKRKGKIGDFKGFPKFSEIFTKRFLQNKDLNDFYPVELCHLEYTPDRGSAIDPHIDDSWIWGERLVTINLGSSTTLTLTPATLHPCICPGNLQSMHEDKMHTLEILYDKQTMPCNHVLLYLKHNNDRINVEKLDFNACINFRMNRAKVVLQIPLPSRSLLVLGGCARYNWYHEIKRQDITSRRLAMTFRELSQEFLPGGPEEELGKKLLAIGKQFLKFST